MTISANKLNRLSFFPVSNPTVLVTFPLFFLTVWVVNIQSQNIIKSTDLTFIAKIIEKFGFVIFIVLCFSAFRPLPRLFITYLCTFLRAIAMICSFVWFAANWTIFTTPSILQIAVKRTKFCVTRRYKTFSNNKFLSTLLTSKCSAIKTIFSYWRIWLKVFTANLTFSISKIYHTIIILQYDIVVKNISPEYCKIAEERLEAVETGVPVKEQRKGQMALFEVTK